MSNYRSAEPQGAETIQRALKTKSHKMCVSEYECVCVCWWRLCDYRWSLFRLHRICETFLDGSFSLILKIFGWILKQRHSCWTLFCLYFVSPAQFPSEMFWISLFTEKQTEKRTQHFLCEGFFSNFHHSNTFISVWKWLNKPPTRLLTVAAFQSWVT